MNETPQPAAPQEDEPKRWPVWAPAVIESLRVTPTIRTAAQRAGIDRRTIQRFMQRNEAFALAVHDAREDALDSIEDAIVLRARSGQPVEQTVTVHDQAGRPVLDAAGNPVVKRTTSSHISDNLAMFFLKRWRPEYRDSYRVETTGAGGGPIQIESRVTDAVGFFDAEVVRIASSDDS